MKLWRYKNNFKYEEDYLKGFSERKGLRLKFGKGVDKEVRESIKKFAKWLRSRYEFPIRVPIYIDNYDHVYTSKGVSANGIFWGPSNIKYEPYIKMAVGDYSDEKERIGRDDILAFYLLILIHELTHYFQWINRSNFDDKQSERQARYYAGEIINEYKYFTEHP